ncbi:ATP-binding protein [Armatimonas sp.]|uniref:ATP-binding protein n=1 Tax=Armatimonas sp. TaxID=1872638 RepID=UPI003753D69F
MESRVQVTLLGSLAAVPANAPGLSSVTHFRTQKTATLFAFLAFHACVPQSREELCARFWPDSELDQARMSLRTALSSLRKDFGEAIVTDKTNVTLQATTDLQQFELATHRASLSSLSGQERVESLRLSIEVYGGPLLPSLYDEWIFPERDRLASAQLAALCALARWHERLGEPIRALDYAHRAAAADPLNEPIRADLIRLLIVASRPAEARRQFDGLEQALLQQLGAEPIASTRALVSDLPAACEPAPPAALVNLPQLRDRFRGRQELLSDVVQRIADALSSKTMRLVTLFGPGGIGKTRLSIEVGHRLAVGYGFAEVHFVGLAGATTSVQAWEVLVEALGLTSSKPRESVQDYVRAHSPCLLILDNLEQLLPDGVALVEGLLSGAPDIVILATSRHRLALPDEQLIAVGALLEDDAIALYRDRARSVAPELFSSSTDEPALRELVTVLDGLPLAIELAAAWAGTLTPSEQARQVRASRLALPEDARKDPRHASMTAAIAWSAELLEPALRDAFLRLSVFQGGWEADAAHTVCAASRGALASLRDRALIRTESLGTTLRFSLHRNLQDFGQATLAPQEKAELIERHQQFFLRLAEDKADVGRLHRERENLTAAVATSPQSMLFRFGLALEEHWVSSGALVEARLWWERALEGSNLPAAILITAGRLAFANNETTQAESLLLQALEQELTNTERVRTHYLLSQLYHTLTSDFSRARNHGEQALILQPDHVPSLVTLGLIARKQGALDEAETLLTHAISDAEAQGLTALAAQAWNGLGPVFHLRAAALEDQGKLVEFEWACGRARECYNRALTLVSSEGQEALRLRVRINQGSLAGLCHDLDGAEQAYSEAVALAEKMGDIRMLAYAQANLSVVLLLRGNRDEYLRLQRASLAIKHRLGIVQDVALAFIEIGKQLAPEVAAVLYGAATTLRSQMGELDLWAVRHAQNYEDCCRALGETAYNAAFTKGAELTLERAVTLALQA